MDVYKHFLASLGLGVFTGLVLPVGLVPAVSVAVIAGTLIDFDHFLISRIVNGNWSYIRNVLDNPVKSIFDIGSVSTAEMGFDGNYRLIAHGLELVAVLSLGLFFASPLLDIAGLAIALHLVCDLYADTFW